MTRKKLNLAYVQNDSMRKATFNKRKKGIMKKIHELTVLCDVEACAIIKSPFSPTPEVWPSVSGVDNVVERFHMLPEMDKQKKMVNHGTFLQQSIDKIQENNIKRMKDNAERTLKEAMFQVIAGKGDTLNMTDINRIELIRYIDQYLKELYHHRDYTLNQPRLEHGESSSSANVMTPRAIIEVGSSSSAPKAIAQNGSFSLAPRVTTEMGSSAFQNSGVLNTPPLISGLGAIRSINSEDKTPEREQVNTFARNFMPTSNDQQGYYLTMNQVGVYDQHRSLYPNWYQHQFGYPSFVGQDGIYYMNQNFMNHQQFGYPPVMSQHGTHSPNQHGEQSTHQAINSHEQMGFHAMNDNNKYHQQ